MYLSSHTYYSFRYGVLSTKELLQQAQQAGITTLALTDINCTSACLDFIRLAPSFNISPIVGIDFRNGADQLFIGIAKDESGFRELNDYLSLYLHSGGVIPSIAPEFSNSYVVYPLNNCHNLQFKENEFIGINPSEFIKLKYDYTYLDQRKLVILAPITFRSKWDDIEHKRVERKRDRNTHRLLRAIDKNTVLSKLSIYEEVNATSFLWPKEELEKALKDYGFLIRNTQEILDQCGINFEFGTEVPYKNQKTYSGSEDNDYALLEKLCSEGIGYRYSFPSDKIQKRIETELEIIRQKDFISYFLINWDICTYARSKGYFYVGRGSGANSIVAYLLRITDVDPIELDLYFERFINLYRQNPPDFDIDFSWKDREDITQYIFNRFDHVALLATYATFQLKAATREIGKVLGVPPHEIDRIQRTPFDQLDKVSRSVVKYGKLIEGFPNHLSIHAGGILISEKPIHSYTATVLPPKGFPTVQFDMVIAEDIGLYKFDILSQRGLGKIKDCLDVIKQNGSENSPIDIHDIQRFKEDDMVKGLLRNGDTVGCFYVESPAMRMLLKKLRVDEYLGLVAASSVIRPGVAKSGMMRQYILRFREPHRRKEAHPILLDIMPDTYGVMVYQEDVIKVAHYFAGLTLGEADVLRRGMSGKYRSREEFHKVKGKYFDNCKQKGHSDKLATDVWRQIESFAGYAFAKGHSASYAVESYQSLFLKAHYPLEYMVATINNGGGFYRMELYVHEARMKGGTIEAPCINNSQALASIQDKTIYLGLAHIAELEKNVVLETIQKREYLGRFKGLSDFIERVAISLEQLTLLIKAEAFRSIEVNKKKLLWEAHFLLGKSKKTRPEKTLFNPTPKRFALPELSFDEKESAFDQQEFLGFPLCSPFDLLRDSPMESIKSKEMTNNLNKTVDIIGYLVHIKNTGTSNGKKMQFGTFIDKDGEFIDTTHFPPVAARYPFKGKGIYKIRGKVVEEFDFCSIEVTSMEKLPYIHDPRYAEEPRHANMGQVIT